MEAKKYYELAFGNHKLCFINLGDVYFELKDYYKAKFYYEKASKQNNSEAIFKIGLLYANGYGVKQSYEKAKEYYEISAKQNNSDALFNLGVLYEEGQGVDQDYCKALEYYERSSIECNSDAQFRLGNIYIEGKFVEQNYQKAKQYFELAALNNNPDGLYHVGHFYLNGDIFDVDLFRAIQYFYKSIKIHKQKIKIHNNVDNYYTMKTVYNNYYYHSHNELGLYTSQNFKILKNVTNTSKKLRLLSIHLVKTILDFSTKFISTKTKKRNIFTNDHQNINSLLHNTILGIRKKKKEKEKNRLNITN